MDEKTKEAMEKRDKELDKKSKSALWEILEHLNVVMCRDQGHSKDAIITDIMTAEFGRRKVEEFYGG